MSPLLKGHAFPNLFLARTDGGSLELFDLRKRRHALILMIPEADADLRAFIDHVQARAKIFEWLQTRLIPVYRRRADIPTPWPAPDYPPCLLPGALPDGVEWMRGYVIDKEGSLIEVYEEPTLMSADHVENDLLYLEARRGVC
jgi:hypothetical protein